MDVAVAELRANLRHWLSRARDGDEVVVTERGIPVVKIVGLESASAIESLIQQGVIARPSSQNRPVATGRQRPRSHSPVSDLVAEQRD
ncbi:type II toxin-antitoxin system Phd/YefM family antitoxin [Candidatus Poriferisocius sp.]|uniref:type II toxin-antitoxin system Phd/YefM family antitoxin n=1 Tax=Candidatus Poriferisocius sp. TaxID=3101276 RepID=UPI003B027EBD